LWLNMTKEQNKPETKETVGQPAVGWRLQDVLLRVNTSNLQLLEVRQQIQTNLEAKPEEGERMAVLQVVSQALLGLSLEEAKLEASRILVPYRTNGEKRRTLVISSASSASASQETECGILEVRGHVIDIPGAIEGRDTRSAREGDTAVISTKAGLMMAKAKPEVKIINLADEVLLNQADGGLVRGSDVYYKADSLLLLQLAKPESVTLNQVVEELKDLPLVYPYNLDEETQLAILGLVKRAGIQKVDVNANSPEVAVELTRKGYKYPTVEEALTVSYSSDTYIMQRSEWEKSQAAQEIGYQTDCVPGYAIKWTEKWENFYDQVVTAGKLLADRYGLESGWIKPDRGTDGGNQGAVNIGTNQQGQELEQRAKEMWCKGGDWVMEAKTNYFAVKFEFDGEERTMMTTPSVHVIQGEPRYTISMQLVDGVAWGGNLICSQKTWERLVTRLNPDDERLKNAPDLIRQLVKSYPQMTGAMSNYVEAINISVRYKNGQVRGGADLAVCTLGGKFGNDKVVVAVQDYNARANGCETAYALYDQAQEDYVGKGEAVTRNITPKVNFDAFSLVLPAAIDEVNKTYGKNISTEQVRLIAVSAGWGQMGMVGTDALEILQDVLLIEKQLRKMNVVE
jgi:hypothetical protein